MINFSRVGNDITWMNKSHHKRVIEIDELCFAYPWSPRDLETITSPPEAIGHIAICNHEIIAYMVIRAKGKTMQILRLGVHPDFRKQSVGTQLVDRVKNRLNSNLRTKIIAEVEDTNLLGQLFFRDMEFKATKVLNDNRPDQTGRYYLFEYNLFQDS